MCHFCTRVTNLMIKLFLCVNVKLFTGSISFPQKWCLSLFGLKLLKKFPPLRCFLGIITSIWIAAHVSRHWHCVGILTFFTLLIYYRHTYVVECKRHHRIRWTTTTTTYVHTRINTYKYIYISNWEDPSLGNKKWRPKTKIFNSRNLLSVT